MLVVVESIVYGIFKIQFILFHNFLITFESNSLTVFSLNPTKSIIKCVIPIFTYLFRPDIMFSDKPTNDAF